MKIGFDKKKKTVKFAVLADYNRHCPTVRVFPKCLHGTKQVFESF